jgi:hypothetical protein
VQEQVVQAGKGFHSASPQWQSSLAGTIGLFGNRIPERPDGSVWPVTAREINSKVVGPLGFEPRTKGFTRPRRFRRAWTISSPATLASRRVGAGRSSLLSRALQPPGSLCTFRRCTAGSAQDCHQPPLALEGFPEFVPSTRRLSAPRHLYQDESPALTAELQARGNSIKAVRFRCSVMRKAVPVSDNEPEAMHSLRRSIGGQADEILQPTMQEPRHKRAPPELRMPTEPGVAQEAGVACGGRWRV